MDSSKSLPTTQSPEVAFLQRTLSCSSLCWLCWLLPRRLAAVALWGRPTSGFHANETEALEKDGSLSGDKLKNLPQSPLAKLLGSEKTSQASFP